MLPKSTRKLYFYKGDVTGDLLETVKASFNSEVGSNKVTVKLSKEYNLEDGQLYTIIIPANCVYSWHDKYTSANVIDKISPADTISFYGGEEDGGLSYKGAIPESGDAAELGVLTLKFNADIKLSESATASLFTNDTTLVKEVPLALSKDSANAVVADFGNERLLVCNKYSVKVPKEAIMMNDTTNTTLAQDILVSYTGTSYYLFNYKTITPDSGSVLATIGEVVLIPEFPAGSAAWEYCGDDAYKGNVSLYKGTDETGELVGTYEFDMGTDLKSERGNVTAVLDPNETYALVIPEGLVPTRGSITIPGYGTTNMRQTHRSAKTIVHYTGTQYAGVTYKVGNTSIKVNDVRRGSSLSFNVTQNDTLSLDSLTLNGVNVTKNIASDSTYTIDSLMNDAVIEAYVSYKPSKTAPETKFYNVEYKVQTVVNDSTMPIASSTTKVAEDSVFTFAPATLDENWTVAVSAGELADSIYSLSITSDTTVTVTYTFNGEVKYVDETASGVYTLDNNQDITISATQGKIVVSGANVGDNISLYALNGAKLGNWEVKQDKQTIDVNSGVYLVVVKGDNGKAAAKVSVK